MSQPLSRHDLPPVGALVKTVSARMPSSVTPATRIDIHPSEWLTLVDEIGRLLGECRNWKSLHDANEACIADLQRQLREAREQREAIRREALHATAGAGNDKEAEQAAEDSPTEAIRPARHRVRHRQQQRTSADHEQQPDGSDVQGVSASTRQGAHMSDSHVPSKEKVCRHMGIPIDREDCNICAREDLAAARASVERLQRAVTSAMDRLSNGDTESGARILRECFWGTAPEPPPARIGPDTPDNSMVICPTCTSQFVAIPVDVQRQLADLSVAYDCATQTNIAQSAKLRAAHEPPVPASKEQRARPDRKNWPLTKEGDDLFNHELQMWQYEEIVRLQQREREAFRLANAATYFVEGRALHGELLAFMNGQITPPEDASAHEPPAVQSEALEAARTALRVDTNVTYPSHISARHIRHVLRELLSAHERLHTLYQATCATYCREHERAAQSPASEPVAALVSEMRAAGYHDWATRVERLGQPPVPEWQPIETAPRGVSVLCYWPAVSRNDVKHEAYIGQAWQRFGNWFRTRDGYGAATDDVNTPTHWQPLPEGPTPEACHECGGDKISRQSESAFNAKEPCPSCSSPAPCICRSVATIQARPDCPVHGMRQEPSPAPTDSNECEHKWVHDPIRPFVRDCAYCGATRVLNRGEQT